WMRVVDVAEQSKIQLMEDPNFMAYGSIPDKGITMTIPALMSAKCILTIVPLELKRSIITDVLNHDTATEELPATIIRNYPGTLFLDRDSCPPSVE
ncbi:MAG: glucosamine-6-phosphate deaminase, partial [Planctomycetes bacterium]|nr:glucosamine-6-phosphate deaminase [Planctomycetota bacterium]